MSHLKVGVLCKERENVRYPTRPPYLHRRQCNMRRTTSWGKPAKHSAAHDRAVTHISSLEIPQNLFRMSQRLAAACRSLQLPLIPRRIDTTFLDRGKFQAGCATLPVRFYCDRLHETHHPKNGV